VAQRLARIRRGALQCAKVVGAARRVGQEPLPHMPARLWPV